MAVNCSAIFVASSVTAPVGSAVPTFVSIYEALQLAADQDVDLVEIAPTAVPPVCRLMDYGKFKYQEQKRAAEAKSKQVVVEIKEVKFRPGTDDGDYNIKMKNIKRFLSEGDKCKITLRFRGREITHMSLGTALLTRIRDELGDYASIEQFPKLEGRQMIMMIAPGKKKFAEEKKAAPAEPKGSRAKHAQDGAETHAGTADAEKTVSEQAA